MGYQRCRCSVIDRVSRAVAPCRERGIALTADALGKPSRSLGVAVQVGGARRCEHSTIESLRLADGSPPCGVVAHPRTAPLHVQRMIDNVS